MDGLYTLWSRPRPNGKPYLSLLEQLLLAVSAVVWRARHGRALLYCDSPYAAYIEAIGLLGLFDAVDTRTVDTASTLDLNPATFWSLARLLALRAAKVPYVALDCDIIVWRDLTDLVNSTHVAVTHLESTEPSPWYPAATALITPPGYRWRPWTQAPTPAANVSMLYLGDVRLRDIYVAEALRFAIGNPARPRPDLGAAPELLFAEQRLLPLAARRTGTTVTPVIEAIWSPANDRFITHDPHYGAWDPLGVKDQPTGITHGWFHKTLLPAADPRRRRLVAELTDTLRRTQPDLLTKLGRDTP